MPTVDPPQAPTQIDWTLITGPPPDRGAVEHAATLLRGKRILLTGAGGSIGAALARRLAAARPAELLLLDSSEAALFDLLRDPRLDTSSPILGSVADTPLLNDLFRRHRPQIVVHAAAFKHVPLLEEHPFAAIANNALATFDLARLAISAQAEQLILVSTDKAVDPTSIMGASKRLAELALLSLGQHGTPTQLRAVRLGNVLGSRGSVVPLFLDHIAADTPLSVTHPDADRYFMTLEQAVAALLAALVFDAPETILVPPLAPPTSILDLAAMLLRHHARPSTHIALTAPRPGDKLHETLLSREERWASEPSSSLRPVVSLAPPLAAFLHHMDALRSATTLRDLPALLAAIQALVPTFTPSPKLAAHTLQGTAP